MTEDEDNPALTGEPRRARRVTASDVAQAIGVSRSAVSRAFSEDSYLDKDKRQLIQKTALQLGYRPNALAASLHGASTNLVGIFAGDMDNHYDAVFVARLVARLNEGKKWPLLIGGSDKVDETTILSVLNYPLDALIIRGGSLQASLIDDCAKLSIPIIFSGHVVDAPFTDCVCCRNSLGSEMAVDCLLERGRKRIGYISGPDRLSSANERLVAAMLRLEKHGLTLVAKQHADFTYEGGRAAAIAMIQAHRPDAILCANDAMALGAHSAARDALGLSLPDDLSIIGFDDIPMASWPNFDLTTVRNPLTDTIEAIVRLLEARLENPDKPSEICMIDPKLVERGTH